LKSFALALLLFALPTAAASPENDQTDLLKRLRDLSDARTRATVALDAQDDAREEMERLSRAYVLAHPAETPTPTNETERSAADCTVAEQAVDGGLEDGNAPSSGFGCIGVSGPWSWTTSDCKLSPIYKDGTTRVSRTGSWSLYFSPLANVINDIYQTVKIPANATATLTYWVAIGTFETTTSQNYDIFGVEILSTSGSVLEVVGAYSNLHDNHLTYAKKTVDLSRYAGQTVRLDFISGQDLTRPTLFYVDDISLNTTVCSTGGGGGGCTNSSTTLCLNNGRFKVEGTYTLQNNGGTGPIHFGAPITNESGYFYFNSAGDIQGLAKVLNGCAINNRYWVLLGGLTDQGTSITVTDTVYPNSRPTYTNPLKTQFQPVLDLNGFPTCP
jgi:hypothetical protein